MRTDNTAFRAGTTFRTGIADRAEQVTVDVTPLQHGRWVAHCRALDKSVYNITWRLAVDRPVHLDTLDAAWRWLVNRHEALRTSIVPAGDSVRMLVHHGVRVSLEQVEIPVDGRSESEVDDELRAAAERVHSTPFDLTAASLTRLVAVTAGERQELVLCVHHLVLDGWGMQLIAEELSDAYADLRCGDEPVAEQPFGFVAYAAEQHEEKTRLLWRQSIDYWQGELTGATTYTIAADTPAPFTIGGPGAILHRRFSEHAAAGIAALAARCHATPVAVLLAAGRIVLARGSGATDVTFGTLLANRLTARDQGVVGYTSNLAQLRASIVDTDTVADAVAAARDGVWASMSHQDVPFGLVHAALPAATRDSVTANSSLVLSHLGPIGGGLRLGDVGLRLLEYPNRTARGDLIMSTWEADGAYFIEGEYSTTRYRGETIAAFFTDLDDVLAKGGADPDRTVGSITVRTRAARVADEHAVDGRAGAGTLP